MSTVDTRGYRKCVRIVIVKGDKILLGKKFIGGKFSYYEFPGGGVEEGETVEQAVVKECLEEVGVLVDNVFLLPGMNFRYEVDYPNPARAKLYRGGEDSWCVCRFNKYDNSLFDSQDDALPYTWETLEGAVKLITDGPLNRFNDARFKVLDLIKSDKYMQKVNKPTYAKW